jgi:hypothetical protein
LERLVTDPLPAELEELLDHDEGEALLKRTSRLLREGRLPEPGDDDWRPYPWPLV